MNEINVKYNAWTFFSEVEIPESINDFLVENEEAYLAYKTVRDVAIFTNKRIIIKDSQGLTGKKIETYTIPYRSINMYSTETAGRLFDFNTELELWTKSGNMKINLKKDIDITKIDRIIAKYIL